MTSTANAAPLKHEFAKGLTLVYAQILPVMAIVSLFPAIPQLFQRFGAVPYAAFLIPMIVTVPSLFIAFTAPFAGAIADRFGRRPSLLAGMLLYVLAGLVPLLTEDLRAIVGSRMALGVAEAFVVTISSTLIGDYFGERRYAWASRVGVWTSVFGTLMLVAGGILADISWRGPFFIYVLAIPGLLMTWLYIDEPAQTSSANRVAGPRAPYPWRQAILIGSLTLVTSVAYYLEPLNIASVLHLVGVKTATTAGLIQAGSALIYVAGALLYKRFSRWSITRLLALSCGCIACGLLIIGLAHNAVIITFGATVQQLGAGAVIPSLLAWGQNILPFEQRGRGMGIWATAFFSGTFLCPPMTTAVASVVGGLQPAIAALGALTLLVCVFALLFDLRRSREPLHV